jgi:hypothetical protein
VLDASRCIDLALVETLVSKELSDNRIEPVAVLSKQPSRVGIALFGDAPPFFVHGVGKSIRNAFRRENR